VSRVKIPETATCVDALPAVARSSVSRFRHIATVPVIVATRHPSFPRSRAGLSTLDVAVVPADNGDIERPLRLMPGVYRLTVLLNAAEVRPRKHVLEVNHTGQWHANETTLLSQGIGVKLVT
jgi:hypothetical protein